MHEIDLPPPFDTKSFALARGRPEASAEPKMADSDRGASPFLLLGCLAEYGS